MDRFIVPFLSHPYTRSVNLKSNMDRFIGLALIISTTAPINLKSNMDRFIEYCIFSKNSFYLI